MKLKHILLFFISLWFVSSSLEAQEDKNLELTDSISKKTKYGLRLGADLSKPVRTFLDKSYTGFEILADFRISKRFYLAAEIGNDNKEISEIYLDSKSSGSYLKAGIDYNMYTNWFGLNNAIFSGLRYGVSTFKQELLSYEVYTGNSSFPATSQNPSTEFTGLTAHWAELIVGIKTEILTNVYLSINLQLKRKISEEKPDNFDNLYIPGFHRTNDFSDYGVGWGYTVSYLIPIFKK